MMDRTNESLKVEDLENRVAPILVMAPAPDPAPSPTGGGAAPTPEGPIVDPAPVHGHHNRKFLARVSR